LQDVVDSINAAATGVTASLVNTGDVSPENLQVFRIELSMNEGGFTLADNGTGLLSALGIAGGAYGEVYEVGTHAGRKMRGYRAANALERIQGSLQTLFETEDTSGSVALKAELVSIFSHLSQHYGGEKLSAAGLDIASLKENFVDISKQSRRRFAKAVFERENLLENLFLKSYSQNENGLIEVLREAIKAELKKSDGSTGALVSTFA